MENKVTLSIIIPTYNRVKFLDTTAKSFISQIEEGNFQDKVEIVIGDDTSPDTTPQYLQELQHQYSFVKTFSNDKNLGLTGNVEKLARVARGELLWLFGDDDLSTSGSIQKILYSAETEKPNVILLNTVNIVSLDDRNLEYKIRGEDRLNIKNDVFLESIDMGKSQLEGIKNWLYLTNLVSASVFRKDLYLTELEAAKKYVRYDSVYMFQAPIVLTIAKHGRFKIIAQRSVLHRKNETNWSGTIKGNFQVSLYDGSEIAELIRLYIPGEYKKYQKIFAVQTFTAVRKGKQAGENINKYIIDAIRRYYNCFPYSGRFFIALITPSFIFKLYSKLWPARSI